MRTQIILGLLSFTLTISNCYGQTAAIDSIEKDYNRGDFGLVIKKVKAELKSDTIIKNRVYYYDRLASVYHFDQRLDSALYFANIAVSLDKNDAGARFVRSLILQDQKKYREALIDLNKAIEVWPEYAIYYDIRSFIHLQLKNKKKAKLDLEKTKELALKQNDPELYKAADNRLKEL